MNTLVSAFPEVMGLFIDDGALAVGILAVIGLAGISVFLFPDVPIAGGAILLFGCLGVLLGNVLRAAQD
jgi:hypothetical protein